MQSVPSFTVRLSSADATSKQSNSNFSIQLPTQSSQFSEGFSGISVRSVTFPHVFPNIHEHVRTLRWYDEPYDSITVDVESPNNIIIMSSPSYPGRIVPIVLAPDTYHLIETVSPNILHAFEAAAQTAYMQLTGRVGHELQVSRARDSVWKMNIVSTAGIPLEWALPSDMEDSLHNAIGFSDNNAAFAVSWTFATSDFAIGSRKLAPVVGGVGETFFPYAFYSTDQIKLQLPKEMARDPNVSGQPFTLEYDDDLTHKFTITNSLEDGLINILGAEHGSPLGTLLGFKTRQPAEMTAEQTAAHVPALYGVSHVFLHSHAIVSGDSLAGDGANISLVCGIPITAPFKAVQSYAPNEYMMPSIVFPSRKTLRNINFVLRDFNGRELVLPENHNMVIEMQVWK